MSASGDRRLNRFHSYWRVVAPSEHFLQVYENDAVFIDSLEEFVAAALQTGDGVIVIATTAHLEILEDRLRLLGFSLTIARSRDQYVALNVDEALSKFMVKGHPDEALFKELVGGLVARVGVNGRQVRAFGEMVAVLWARGERSATLRLEHFWHQLCREYAFSLLCAYPRSGFVGSPDASLMAIHAAHSTVVA